MTFPKVEERFYGKRDLAHRYGRSILTICRWERDGKIPKGVYIGNKKTWTPDNVMKADRNLLSMQK